MAVWAYTCRRCGDPQTTYFAACSEADELPADARIVHVKVGKQWLCAELDRSERHAIDGMLVRKVVAAGAADCDECRDV